MRKRNASFEKKQTGPQIRQNATLHSKKNKQGRKYDKMQRFIREKNKQGRKYGKTQRFDYRMS